jgi:hypothetical protein
MPSALTSDLSALAQFSETDHGVTRVAWSDELFSAYAWVSNRAAETGLVSRIDAAGNLHLEHGEGSQRIMIGGRTIPRRSTRGFRERGITRRTSMPSRSPPPIGSGSIAPESHLRVRAGT